MTYDWLIPRFALASGLGFLASAAFTLPSTAAEPYKILQTSQSLGTGRIDYVSTDSLDRRIYVDLEDKDKIAVIDANSLKLVTSYSLEGKGGGPGALGLDAKNHILFAMCHEPATCVVLNADDGKILATLPIGKGTDAGEFNPNTMEAFSSQGDGTLTIIKETSPTTFEVEQTVQTKPRAKTCALDTKNNAIVVITTEAAPSAPGAPPPATPPPAARQGGEGPRGGPAGGGPAFLDIMVIGR